MFLEWHEVPGLAVGALRGDAVALRRIVGARRAARIGALLSAVGLLAAAPLATFVPLALGHLLVALGAWGATQNRSGARPREALRLSLWCVALPLIVAVPLRLFWPDSALPATAAILVGNAFLWRALGRGFGQSASPSS